ncbi:MAG: hypothetical protein AB7I30_17255 [Isosphaeraceae bacterium]
MIIERGRRGFVAAMTLCALTLGGCGEHEEYKGTSRRVVAVKDLPENVLKAAKASLPGIDFQDSWSNHGPDGTLESYEVRGRAANGKIREVRVSLDGKILEME